MKTKTIYSTDPRRSRTRLYLNDMGERDAISVCSRFGDTEAETLYVYRQGKRKIAHRVEKRNTKTTEILYPVLTGKPIEIREHQYLQGKLISTTTYDEHWNEINFKWAD